MRSIRSQKAEPPKAPESDQSAANLGRRLELGHIQTKRSYPAHKPPPPKSKVRPKHGGEPYSQEEVFKVVATRVSEIHQSSLYYVDSKVVVIYDAYPKAKIHLLVIPRRLIHTLKQVTREDLELLKHMSKVAREIANHLRNDKERIQLRVGYHAIPSTAQLHLHIISDDFQGPCLRTNKQYNSFASAFFLDPDMISRMVAQNGKVTICPGIESLLTEEMRCIHCEKFMKTIPDLRLHLTRCPGRGEAFAAISLC